MPENIIKYYFFLMEEKLVIDFTPTGMIPTKRLTSFVPVTASEIVEDVHAAWELGITKVHLHARNPKTEDPTYKKDIYAEIIEEIRKFAPSLVVCVSLRSRTYNKFEERSEVLELKGSLKPDVGSLTLSSLNFN
jgi:3-keto-5-aminohexanoate cleavage enzyme